MDVKHSVLLINSSIGFSKICYRGLRDEMQEVMLSKPLGVMLGKLSVMPRSIFLFLFLVSFNLPAISISSQQTQT
jgi:hypothetical protein